MIDTKNPVHFYDDRGKDDTIYVMKDVLYENDFICLCTLDYKYRSTILNELDKVKILKTVHVKQQRYQEAAELRDQEHILSDRLEKINGQKLIVLFNKHTKTVDSTNFQFWMAANYKTNEEE